jgi:hypothetical protein
MSGGVALNEWAALPAKPLRLWGTHQGFRDGRRRIPAIPLATEIESDSGKATEAYVITPKLEYLRHLDHECRSQ